MQNLCQSKYVIWEPIRKLAILITWTKPKYKLLSDISKNVGTYYIVNKKISDQEMNKKSNYLNPSF